MTAARTEPLQVFFDYTCPFAYRLHRWFEHLDDVATRWQPFSLLEHNHRGDGPPVWRVSEHAEDISLLAFAGHAWVVAEGADLHGYRREVFRAWHEVGSLTSDDLVAVATAAGAHGDLATLRRHFLEAEASHQAALRLGVFGSPTLVFAPGMAAFVKLEEPPPTASATRLLDAIETMAELPAVVEIKRTARPDEDT